MAVCTEQSTESGQAETNTDDGAFQGTALKVKQQQFSGDQTTDFHSYYVCKAFVLKDTTDLGGGTQKGAS